METIDLAQLEEAVVVFYRTTSQEQAITHNWLTKVQQSPQAWQFSWQLMQPGKSQEVQFFGAITLHTKLLKSWHEVPPESHEELKQKILEYILQFANGPKLVLNRLCIALSAFIVHMLSEWPTAIEDVINTFQAQQIPNVSRETQLWIMLEVLQAIPEEMQALHTSVKRVALRAEVSRRVPLVMETIELYLKLQLEREWDNEVLNNLIRAVKCVGTWVNNIGFALENCQNIVSLMLQIVNKCYWRSAQANDEEDDSMSIEENELSEICLKTMQTIIIQPDCERYPRSAFTLIKMFIDSLCGITKAEWKQDNANEDIAVNIYSLFVSSVERHSRLLMSGLTSADLEMAELYSRMVNEIIQCTDKPGTFPVEESSSVIAMGFWYLLQDEVLSICNPEERGKCLEFIKPVYAHLTRILVRKAEPPNQNTINLWSAEDLESFRCYRQDIADTYIYCCDVLGDHILDILFALLEENIALVQANPDNWNKLEAVIFAFLSISEHFNDKDSKQIPKLIHVLAEIPYDKMNEKLLGTALETVGVYSQWFRYNTNYIRPAIELLVRGLNTGMSSQATLGLKEMCRDCQLQLRPYAQPLLNACHNCLSAGRLKNPDAVRLMYSMGMLMSLLPAEQLPSYLDMIVSPCFEELQAILCHPEKKGAAERDRTVLRLNMISTLFSSLNTNVDDDDLYDEEINTQPVLIVMQKTMPIFTRIAEFWINEMEVLESACTALKHAVTNLQFSFKPMLNDLCYFIAAIMQTKCCEPIIEIAKSTIVVFYRHEECTSVMHQLLIELIANGIKLFESALQTGLSQISDTVETFYCSLLQLVKKLPQGFNDSCINQQRLIFFALKAISLPESGPIRTGVQFLMHFVMQSRNYPLMTHAVQQTGEEIVRVTLLCIGSLTARQHIDKYADILLAINKKYPAELVSWLRTTLHVQDFPTPLVDESEKQQFAQQIIREKVNKRLLQKHLNDFAIKSRGLSGKFE